MRTRLVRVQLLVFAVVTVLAVGYAAYAYGGAQRYTGIGTYTVSAELPAAGGLYPSALVTYRGVDVGVVTGLDATESGARARLQIRSGTSIPAAVTAYVRSVSVAGEQFIDLVPDGSSRDGNLRDGSVIDRDNTRIPVPAGEVIDKVTTLLDTVPKDDLRVLLDESSTALRSTGDQLNRALDASSSLVSRALADFRPTATLITDLDPLLATLVDAGPDISSFSTDLASFTGQLRLSDGAIRTALRTGTPFADSVSGLAGELTPTLPVLLANLQTVGEVLRVNVPGLRHVLVVYPAVVSAANAIVAPFQIPSDTTSGQGELDIKLGNTQNPVPCSQGYQDIARRNPGDLTSVAAPVGQYCTLPRSDPRVARGARNTPCATDPSVRTAHAAQCPGGPPSTWSDVLSRPGVGYVPDVTGDAPAAAAQSGASSAERGGATARQAVPYDPITGRFRVPGSSAVYAVTTSASRPDARSQEVPWLTLFPR